jgi:hypothetical protein
MIIFGSNHVKVVEQGDSVVAHIFNAQYYGNWRLAIPVSYFLSKALRRTTFPAYCSLKDTVMTSFGSFVLVSSILI